MTNVSEIDRQRVRQRAGNRCEYCLCHQDYVMGWLQIDHVIPIAKNGSDDLDNKNQVVDENEVIAVETKTALEPSAYEQALLGIVRALPPERVVQILDYARYIESQAGEDFGILHDDETQEEVIADEAQWDAQFAETQGGLKKMAEKVREDIRAGRTPNLLVFYR